MDDPFSSRIMRLVHAQSTIRLVHARSFSSDAVFLFRRGVPVQTRSFSSDAVVSVPVVARKARQEGIRAPRANRAAPGSPDYAVQGRRPDGACAPRVYRPFRAGRPFFTDPWAARGGRRPPP